jgi:hypothetical protein
MGTTAVSERIFPYVIVPFYMLFLPEKAECRVKPR